MKIGDYVRTKKYGITKILGIGEYLGIKQYLISYDGDYVIDNGIIKSSPNIIDLIVADDYVNGLRVEESKYGELYTAYTYMGGDIGRKPETYINFIKDLDVKDIQSIVTKEKFASMEYRIGNE